jgi:hypothetical protein
MFRFFNSCQPRTQLTSGQWPHPENDLRRFDPPRMKKFTEPRWSESSEKNLKKVKISDERTDKSKKGPGEPSSRMYQPSSRLENIGI